MVNWYSSMFYRSHELNSVSVGLVTSRVVSIEPRERRCLPSTYTLLVRVGVHIHYVSQLSTRELTSLRQLGIFLNLTFKRSINIPCLFI